MTSTGNVVELAARPGAYLSPGRRSVAAIAEALARNAGLADEPPPEKPPLAVHLDALCGVDDATVSRLAHIATSGALTAESAARLAIRHAEEIDKRDRSREWASPVGPASRFEIVVSGDLFDDYAIRVARSLGGPKVCAAPASRVERLLSAFPARGFDICLVVSEHARTRPSVRILADTAWRRSISRRMRRPEWAAVRHLVVVGGLPDDPIERAAIIVGIREAVGRARRRCSEDTVPVPADALPLPVLRILPLIELALPGLVSSR